jgi:predicted regulator of Ras-like GTPase activity (Roadblock/LC7/MglB family)
VPELNLNNILAEMAGGLAGVWVMVIADNDGMLLAAWASPENRLPPEQLGGFIVTINSAIDSFKQSTTDFGRLDDVIFTMGFSTLVIKPIADGACFMVIQGPKTVPLGMVRMAANNYAPKLESALPGHGSRRDGMGTIVP